MFEIAYWELTPYGWKRLYEDEVVVYSHEDMARDVALHFCHELAVDGITAFTRVVDGDGNTVFEARSRPVDFLTPSPN